MYQKSFILLFLLSFFSVTYAKGPWPQGKGKSYIKLSEWWMVYDKHYTDAGLLDPNTTTGIFNTSLYAEYGVTDRITGIVYFPFFSRNYMNNLVSATTGTLITPGEAINSLGDTDIALKFALNKRGSSIPLSATVLFGIPLGEDAGGTQENLQTGDGELNQMLQLDAGYSMPFIKNNWAYTSAYIGVNNRTQGYSDEFRYGAEFGFSLANQKLWTTLRLQGVESLNNGLTADLVTSGIFANNASYTSYGIELAYYATPNLGISASVSSAFRGEIIAAAPSYSVGLFLDLSK